MEQLSFIESFRTSPFILTEGAIVERLRHEFHISPDKHIAHAALIYDDSHREILASIYRQYLQIATEFRLPLMLMTPTRRANIEQIAASDYRHKNVLADTMSFLSRFRDEASTPVYIGGLAGCRGNAYDGRYYLSVEEAMEFHFPTVRTLAQSGADYLFAGIMPQLTEAIGMANAMAATGLPYIISFMICRDGRLIDVLSFMTPSMPSKRKLPPAHYAIWPTAYIPMCCTRRCCITGTIRLWCVSAFRVFRPMPPTSARRNWTDAII